MSTDQWSFFRITIAGDHLVPQVSLSLLADLTRNNLKVYARYVLLFCLQLRK